MSIRTPLPQTVQLGFIRQSQSARRTWRWIATLRERIERYEPHWVVLCGVDRLSLSAWNELVGQPVEIGQLCRIASSPIVLVTNPQDRVSDEAWVQNADILMNDVRSASG